jgi:hypothetical protein
MWKPGGMLRSRGTSSVSVPKPVAAGIGLVSRAPQALTELGLRLPSLAFVAVQEARARYEEYARLGAEVLAKREGPADDGGEPAATNASLYAVRDDELWDDELGEDEFEEQGAGFAVADDSGPVGLPLDNYDALTLPQVRARLSRLSVTEVEALRDYESAHGRRLPILTMLENRLSKLSAES